MRIDSLPPGFEIEIYKTVDDHSGESAVALVIAHSGERMVHYVYLADSPPGRALGRAYDKAMEAATKPNSNAVVMPYAGEQRIGEQRASEWLSRAVAHYDMWTSKMSDWRDESIPGERNLITYQEAAAEIQAATAAAAIAKAIQKRSS